MLKFIKLTQGINKKVLYLAVDKIVSVRSYLDETYIACVDSIEDDRDYIVNETVDEVMFMIYQSHQL